MKTYEEMAENVFRRRNEYIENKKRQRKKTVKLSVSFVCMAAVLLAGLSLLEKGSISNKPLKENETNAEQTLADSVIPGEKDYYGPGDEPQENNGNFQPADGEEQNGNAEQIKIIDSFEQDGGPTACYAVPENGKSFFSIPLNRAFEAYGDTAEDTGEKIVYRVVVRAFKNGKMLQTKEELSKIAEKFYAWGYTSALEVVNDRWDYAVLTLIASEEELKNLPEDKDNAYFFFLYNEQDGMGESLPSTVN